MALSIVFQESHVFFRLFNACIESIKHDVAQIFANVFSFKPYSPANNRPSGHGNLLPFALEDLIISVGNQYQVTTQDWFSQNKGHDEERDPRVVFNVLDAILKDSLERLKMMRESVSLTKIGLNGCTLEVDYTGCVAMIRNLCLEGKLRAALWLRNKMIQKGVIPDVLTHNYLVNGLCKAGDLEKADNLVREMLEIGPSPNCATFNTFIKGYCLNNNVDKALYLFSTMANSGIGPNKVTYNILIHALCKKGLLKDARKLLEMILDDDCGKETSDIITSTIFMDGCLKKGDMVQALVHWDEMLQRGTQIEVGRAHV